MQRRTFRAFTLLLICASIILLACDLGSATAGKPTVILTSPPHGSQFREGEDVGFQSTATDSAGVTRVELMIDGAVVKTDSVPGSQGQPSFTLVQTWKATQGTHAASVRAYNISSVGSDPATISITVSPAASQSPVPSAGPSAAATAASACANTSAFVADVTVPDGTLLAPGQTFNKIWRIRNSGSCTWGTGYQLVFVTGEAMTASTVIAVPNTAPGATVDLLVAMTASTTPGVHAGQWRLKSASGTVFGDSLSVSINVQSPAAPTATTAPPTITPTTVPAPASGSCISGFVWRMASPTDKTCVPPASRDQAQADNAAAASRKLLEYGPDTCISGYVWREAYSGDHVCVTGAVRSQAAADNAAAASRWVSGPYGAHTCISGFVWREARSGDDVCVTLTDRTQTASDNAAAASRVVVAPYGPDTCKTGYVWREAWSGDHVCVTSAVRTQVQADNAAAPSRTNP